MYELSYCSLAKPGIHAGDIAAILKSSQENNQENEITGCLLYYNNEFVQVLEGDIQKVKELKAKIEKDMRHSNMRILGEGEKEERTFKNWTMAYRELNAEEVRDMSTHFFENNFQTFSQLASKPTRTIRLFWNRAQFLVTVT